MSEGWIKLYRQIQDCDIWDDDEQEPFDKRSAWIDLLLLANHKDKQTVFDMKPFVVKRGQRITSIRKLGERWHWSRDRVSRYLKLLESLGMIIKESDSRKTLLTIVNYEVYQDTSDSDEDSYKDTEKTLKRHSQGTNKNEKNEKNEKKYNSAFAPPTLEEVTEYCQERKNNVNPQKFIDFYESKGWMIGKNKMKDWKASVRTWENKDKKTTDKTPQYKQFSHSDNYSDLDELLAN